jgi:hypothetical protein
MPTKKPDALSFCRTYLRRKPDAPYAEIRDAAKKKKLLLYPISFGRAKDLEGLITFKPRKDSVPKKRGRPKGSKNKPKVGAVTRGPGRPRATSDLTGLDTLVSTIRSLERERDEAVKALEKIRELVR